MGDTGGDAAAINARSRNWSSGETAADSVRETIRGDGAGYAAYGTNQSATQIMMQ